MLQVATTHTAKSFTVFTACKPLVPCMLHVGPCMLQIVVMYAALLYRNPAQDKAAGRHNTPLSPLLYSLLVNHWCHVICMLHNVVLYAAASGHVCYIYWSCMLQVVVMYAEASGHVGYR